MTGSMWSKREDWGVIAAAIDLRVARAGAYGHAGWCVLPDPHTRDVAAHVRCSRAAPAIQTLLAKQMDERIEDVLGDNDNPLTRRCVMLEGPSYAGKTTSTMLTVLKRDQDALKAKGRYVVHPLHRIPWVYVEVGENWGYKSILLQIHRFLDQPVSTAWNAETLMDKLRDVLPDHDVEGIVIDDSHMLRSRPEGHSIDGYKSLVTGLPALLVFIGLEPLKESALLIGAEKEDATSAKQIYKRADLWNVVDETTAGYRRKTWDVLVADLSPQFHLPDEQIAMMLADTALRDELHRATEGLTGDTYDLLKRAAVRAIRGKKTTFRDEVRAGAKAAIAKREEAKERDALLTRDALKAAQGRKRRTGPLRAHTVGAR
jgi:hypothetical protein